MIHLLLFIFMPIGVSFIHYFLHNKISKYFIIISQIIMLISILYSAVRLNQHEILTNALLNIPLPYGMALELDFISLILMTLNIILFSLTLLFAMQKPYFKPSFGLIFLSLQGVLNAVFLSTDLFNVYVLLEITTVLATLLIMSQSENKSVYHALMYLMTNLVSMAFFLLGIGYLYKMTGYLDFQHIKLALSSMEDMRQLNLPFAFLFTGISLKAAVFPLFSWLPKAHAAPSAPSVVSAVLSGIMVKSGLYVLIRLQMLFGPYLPIDDLILVLGYFTSIIGFLLALSHTQIKLVLAYSTISQIGLILIGLGYNNDFSNIGSLYHMLSHGLFKPLLFLLSGLFINYYHTHDLEDMSHLWKISKPLSVILLVALFSITGAPFFSGAISKSMIGNTAPFWVMQLITLGTMLYSIKFLNILKPKKNLPPELTERRFDIKKTQWTSLTILSVLSLVLGLFISFVLTLFWNVEYPSHLADLLFKSLNYTVLLCMSYAIYQLRVPKSKLLTVLRQIDITFNQSSIAIMIYFALVLAYLAK